MNQQYELLNSTKYLIQSTEPSVTSVLSAVRQYVVWYLLKNNMLKKTDSNKLNKEKIIGNAFNERENRRVF